MKYLFFFQGWTPSTFVSRRDQQDGESSTIQRPEDFMDDEVQFDPDCACIKNKESTWTFYL